MNFLSIDQASNSPLAQKLFSLKDVKSVFLGYDFITITKQEEAKWELIKAEILVSIMDFLVSGQEAVISDYRASRCANAWGVYLASRQNSGSMWLCCQHERSKR